MFSFRRKYAMQKWRSDTPKSLKESLQMGGMTPDPNAAAMAAGNASIAGMNTTEPTGQAPLEGAVGVMKGMGMKKMGGCAPGKMLMQGKAGSRKVL